MKRIFKPQPHKKTPVERRVWIKSEGLMVEYYDGFRIKSAYTLPELLKIEKPTEDGRLNEA